MNLEKWNWKLNYRRKTVSEELKPCPFCLGESRVDSKSAYWFIYCEECGGSSGYSNTKVEAIKAWNTREGKENG